MPHNGKPRFLEECRQSLKTTLSIINGAPERSHQEERTVEIREDPLFFQYSTLIALDRSKKPTIFRRPKLYYEQHQIEEALEIVARRQPGGFAREHLRADLLGALHELVERDKQAHNAKCPFCHPQLELVTPLPRIEHQLHTLADRNFQLGGPPDRLFVSVPNLYPFTMPHYVTIFPQHTPDLRHLRGEDLHGYVESGFELAHEIRKCPGVDGMWDIINWGPQAAASQAHPHAQRGGIARKMITEMDMEIAACAQARRFAGGDPFVFHMERLRDSDLFGFENDLVFIHAPFAPKFPHQIDIICRPPRATLLDLQPDERRIIGESMLGVFHLLHEKAGVTDLNVITHQARFTTDPEVQYHLHWHVMPRNLNKLGGIEVNINNYVVSVLPEETARLIHGHYHGT